MKAVICPYCGSHAILQDAFVIYRRMGFGQVYQCPNVPCDAYVGVHENTVKSKGSLADWNLRELRKQVHVVFDPLWRGNRMVERTEVYAAAAQVLSLKEFHIGDMRDEQAQAFLDNSDALIDDIQLTIQRNRLIQLSPQGSQNLLSVLRYLYVGSQRAIAHVLPYNAYRGHACSFKAALEAGLVRKFKKQVTGNVFYALTPAGCSAIGIAPN
jgi:hypothetical protein